MFCRIRDKQPGCAGIPAEVDISGLRLYRLPVIRSGDSLTFILNKNEFSDLWIRKENYCQIITKNGELL